jgi:hypothetical protein
MAQRRIDRMNEVEAGIDECAVEIEDNKSDRVRIEWTPAVNLGERFGLRRYGSWNEPIFRPVACEARAGTSLPAKVLPSSILFLPSATTPPKRFARFGPVTL